MKRHFLSATATIITCAICLASQPLAQTPARPESRSRANNRRARAITGRVLSDSGQPLFNAQVSIMEIGRRRTGSRTVNTDEEGRFRFNDLPRGNYAISTRPPGYVVEPPSEPRFYRPGDEVSFTAIKGGVITGAVTNSLGEPLIEARIRPIRVRDATGRPVRQSMNEGQTITDDRGHYRLYGLRPGVYIVLAGGRGFSFSTASPYQKDVPTYYPSSTRDTAAEVIVASGQEITGVDIRYRGDRGSAISGTVAELPSASLNTGMSVELYNASTHMQEDWFYINQANTKRSFDFYGLTDGDYYLIAVSQPENQIGATSQRHPVKIKGSDVTGIQISLIPDGSISGMAMLEHAQPQDVKSRCEPSREFAAEDLLVVFRRDYKEASSDTARPGGPTTGMRVPPDDKGQFEVRNLQPGRYRPDAYLPDENWYVRAISMPAPARSRAPVDGSQNGIAVKAGERVTGVTLIIAEGAAGVAGRVTPAREGATLPDRLKVHLIPDEREQLNNPLRFRETTAQSDGSFSISNIAPGKYFLLARAEPDEIDLTAPVRPAAWDAERRKSLGQEATTSGVNLTLQPCQRAAGILLKYSPQAKPARRSAASTAGR